MKRYRPTGNYGTFEITKVVEAEDITEAHCETGIAMDLEEVGWTFTHWPDGEDWMVERLDSYGRLWLMADAELCEVCGQPDNCGDCEHGRLTIEQVTLLGGREVT